MARRRQKEKNDLDVTGYLSIMAIVLKLITLILTVLVIRIAMNPHAIKVVSLGLFSSSRIAVENPKIPTYIDCHPTGLVIYPGEQRLTWENLQQTDNPLEKLLERIQDNNDKEYVIVMVRPGSVKFYRAVRNMVGRRPIDVGYDVVDTHFKVNWIEAMKALQITE